MDEYWDDDQDDPDEIDDDETPGRHPFPFNDDDPNDHRRWQDRPTDAF